MFGVPADANSFRLDNHCLGFKSESDWAKKDSNGWCLIELGLFGGKDYEIIGVYPNELEAEQVKSIVDFGNEFEHSYANYTGGSEFALYEPLKSFASLMEANNCFVHTVEKPRLSDHENYSSEFDEMVLDQDSYRRAYEKYNHRKLHTSEKWIILLKKEK